MASIKKYNGSSFENADIRKYSTASEIITPPTTIYADGSNITTYTIKGNTVQNGTPTPSNPVAVVGVGELETTGEHSGEYKIPILSNQGSAVNYLGSVQSTRQIKKLVLTGNEDWYFYGSAKPSEKPYDIYQFYTNGLALGGVQYSSCISTIADYGMTASTRYDNNYGVYLVSSGTDVAFQMEGSKAQFPDVTAWQQYLAQQYANGTPVTVWYVLATPTTGIVNEPLMKIGDYADSISNATPIPTTEGANSITVDTTVQPSEFTATWTGWHDAYVKEYDGSDWQ